MALSPEELARQIKDAREKQDPASKGSRLSQNARGDTSAGKALRAATDLVAALVVGTFLGYGIDRFFGSKPWGMIIFFFLGFAAGFLNIYRAQMGQDFKVGFKKEDKK